MASSSLKQSILLLCAIGLGMALMWGWIKSSEKRNPSRLPPAVSKEQPKIVDQGLLRTDYHAIVIGINRYTHGWNSLKTAQNDAEQVADVLSKKYGFRTHLLLDEQATRKNVLLALDKAVELNDQDSLLIYYAGHGHYDEDLDEGFLIPSDAGVEDGSKEARTSWIWNSTLTKIMNASRARHILLISDSCYSGALFRSGDALSSSSRAHQWYKRAFSKPSRYLIASGDLERVQDSGGGRHSVFAHQVLHFLRYAEQPIFSASDLAHSIRSPVASQTGQHVRIGHLALAAHAGGEFVFIADPSLTSAHLLQSFPPTDTAAQGLPEPSEIVSLRRGYSEWDALADAESLARHGALRSAGIVVSQLATNSPSESLLSQAVRNLSSPSEKADSSAHLRDSLTRLQLAGNKTDPHDPDKARPRVVAILGPRAGTNVTPGHARRTNALLAEAFSKHPGFWVVSRDALADILGEYQIAAGELSDERLRATVGRLLPASLLVTGELEASGQGDRMDVGLRLIDTASSRILNTQFHTDIEPDRLLETSQAAASHLIHSAKIHAPLQTRLHPRPHGQFAANIGRFHRLTLAMPFDVIASPPASHELLVTPPPPAIGTALPLSISENEALFTVTWKKAPPDSLDNPLWITEQLAP